jgi:hypothetical protein
MYICFLDVVSGVSLSSLFVKESKLSLQHTENGCEVQRDMEGMYKYIWLPGLTIHGRGRCKVIFKRSSGRDSITAVV